MRAEKDNTYCSYPLNHVAVDTKGKFKLCCLARPSPIGVSGVLAEEWFSSDYLNGVRAAMRRGERVAECAICYKNEELGLESKRLRPRTHLGPLEWPATPVIRSLDWRQSNACNAQCVNCGPGDSSAWHTPALSLKEHLPELQVAYNRQHTNENFEKVFGSEARDGLVEAYFAGGEPFFMPEMPNILSLLHDDCRIEINTNLSRLNDEILKELARYKRLTIICSVDGVGEGFEMMRHPLRFNILRDNLAKLSQIPSLSVVFNFTLSMLSVHELIRVVELAQEWSGRFSQFGLDVHALVFPTYLQIANLSQAYRERVSASLLEQLPPVEGFLRQIDRLERVKDLISALRGAAPGSAKDRADAIVFVRWLIKERPEHVPYLRAHGYFTELNLSL